MGTTIPNLNRRPVERTPQNIIPNRLDTRTKVSLMAAVMYGLSDCKNVEEAVDIAFEIDNLVGIKLNKLKEDNPPRAYKGNADE